MTNLPFMMKIINICFLWLFVSTILNAGSIQKTEGTNNVPKDSLISKSNPDSSIVHNLFLSIGYMQMRSTHGSIFRGCSLILGYRYSPYVYYGFGIKYAYTYYHFDNDWYLHHLKFLPVFVFARLNFMKNRMITPYFHLSTGITFINYEKEDKHTIGHPYSVSEQGLYFNSGFGCAIKIGKHFTPVLEAGFQGCHMSFNQLAVNPHGVNLQIGVVLW